MRVIGFLGAGSPGPFAPQVAVFRQGLAETGYVEGRNVAIEYRFAEGQYDRLPTMAEEMVRRQVAVIVAFPIPAAVAAKAATTTIPIVFNVAGDPVKLGLVAGLAQPGGNATGAAEQRDERAPLHSITSSASESKLSEIVTPSDLAVLRLMTNSNFVDWIIGRSAAFAPFRMRPT